MLTSSDFKADVVVDTFFTIFNEESTDKLVGIQLVNKGTKASLSLQKLKFRINYSNGKYDILTPSYYNNTKKRISSRVVAGGKRDLILVVPNSLKIKEIKSITPLFDIE